MDSFLVWRCWERSGMLQSSGYSGYCAGYSGITDIDRSLRRQRPLPDEGGFGSLLMLRPFLSLSLLHHDTISHMTEQLLALSLRRSEATAARSGRPGMCEILLAPRDVLPRLTPLPLLLMHASVATWKMSRTLFSDCCAEHSM